MDDINIKFDLDFQLDFLINYQEKLNRLSELKYIVTKKDLTVESIGQWRREILSIHKQLRTMADEIDEKVCECWRDEWTRKEAEDNEQV